MDAEELRRLKIQNWHDAWELRQRRAEHDKAACEDEGCELCGQVSDDYDEAEERLAAHGDALYDAWKDSRHDR